MGTAFCRHLEVSMHRPKTSPKPTPVDVDLTTIALSIIVGDGMARDLLERMRGMSPKSRAERAAARASGDTERAEAERTAIAAADRIIGVVNAKRPSALMEELELARRHVLEARRIIAEQRQRVQKLREEGGDTTEAEQSLDFFEQSLANFEGHLRDITNTPIVV